MIAFYLYLRELYIQQHKQMIIPDKRITLLVRIRFAWNAFWLKKYEQTFPYKDSGEMRPGLECDNSRRKSKCTNEAKRFLDQTVLRIDISDAHGYFCCQSCADKYIGTMDGEDWK